MADTRTKIQARYDAKNRKAYSFKLNVNYDADIIEKLDSVESINAYIKHLIREDIIRTRTESVPVSESDNDMEPLFQNMIRDEM